MFSIHNENKNKNISFYKKEKKMKSYFQQTKSKAFCSIIFEMRNHGGRGYSEYERD